MKNKFTHMISKIKLLGRKHTLLSLSFNETRTLDHIIISKSFDFSNSVDSVKK